MPESSSPSLPKIAVTFFSTAPTPMKSGLSDGGVRAPLGHQLKDLALARGQRGERIVAPPEQLRDDLRVEHGAAVGDPVDRVDQLGERRDAVLQQVADATAAGAEQLLRVGDLDVLRQQQDAGARQFGSQPDRRAHPLIPERRRHPHVEHGEIRRESRSRRQQRVGVAVRADDLVPGLDEDAHETLAQEY